MNIADMPFVMDQCTDYARFWERISGSSYRQTAQRWRDRRWERLDQEIERAKSRQWALFND